MRKMTCCASDGWFLSIPEFGGGFLESTPTNASDLLWLDGKTSLQVTAEVRPFPRGAGEREVSGSAPPINLAQGAKGLKLS